MQCVYRNRRQNSCRKHRYDAVDSAFILLERICMISWQRVGYIVRRLSLSCISCRAIQKKGRQLKISICRGRTSIAKTRNRRIHSLNWNPGPRERAVRVQYPTVRLETLCLWRRYLTAGSRDTCRNMHCLQVEGLHSVQRCSSQCIPARYQMPRWCPFGKKIPRPLHPRSVYIGDCGRFPEMPY